MIINGVGAGNSSPEMVNISPALNVFLCLIGTLCFLQCLLIFVVSPGASDNPASPVRVQVPVKIRCSRDLIVAEVPDLKFDVVADRLGPLELQDLRSLKAKRSDADNLRSIAVHSVNVEKSDAAEQKIQGWLDEALLANRLAQAARADYHEFVSIVIEPGGIDHYYRLRSLLRRSNYRSLRVLVEAFSPTLED